MKNEFEIEETWEPYELHPETPPEGVLMSKRFAGMDIEGMFAHLNNMGRPLGIEFGKVEKLSNSRLMLQAGELAREAGVFEKFHDLGFKAFFRQGLDIGDRKVVLELGEKAGLRPEELSAALDEQRYAARVDSSTREAHELGVNAIPTFFFNGHKQRLVGAQPVDAFRKMLTELSK